MNNILRSADALRDRIALLVVAALSLYSCADPSFDPPEHTAETIFWEVKANHRAIQMSTVSPNDTLSINAYPVDVNGQLINMTEIDADIKSRVLWVSSDSSKVKVTQDGYLRAIAETPQVDIVCRITIGRVTHNLTIVVKVNSDPSPLPIIEFDIQPKDSAKRAAINIIPYIFPISVANSLGPVAGFPIHWSTSNRKNGRFDGSRLTISKVVPDLIVYAEATYYGVVSRDSFVLEVGYPVAIPFGATQLRQSVNSELEVVMVERPSRPRIGPGGSISFENNTAFGPTNISGKPPIPGSDIDIIFDDPNVARAGGAFGADTSGPGGNIMVLPSDTTKSIALRRVYRRFIKPGEHFYTIQPYGVRGSVIVENK